jgi:hypothetical protein
MCRNVPSRLWSWRRQRRRVWAGHQKGRNDTALQFQTGMHTLQYRILGCAAIVVCGFHDGNARRINDFVTGFGLAHVDKALTAPGKAFCIAVQRRHCVLVAQVHEFVQDGQHFRQYGRR